MPPQCHWLPSYGKRPPESHTEHTMRLVKRYLAVAVFAAIAYVGPSATLAELRFLPPPAASPDDSHWG